MILKGRIKSRQRVEADVEADFRDVQVFFGKNRKNAIGEAIAAFYGQQRYGKKNALSRP
jgi:hypothetical protein